MIYQGNAVLGDFFISRREKGKNGLPTLSVTLHDGIINRDDLDRKMDTNLSPEKHLLINKNDLAYNMMRMWQGACGLSKVDGLVSPAYVVLVPKPNIDSEYAAYLFKTPRMIYLFWAYSYGLTKDRLRLYYNDFKRIPVEIPSRQQQIKIAKVLSIWDKAIVAVEKLIVSAQQEKKALMQQLLTGEKRLPNFTDKWKDWKLIDFAKIIVSPVDKKSIKDEILVKLCNYTDVYYNTYITHHILFMRATAKQSEIDKYTLQVNDVVITKDSESPEDIARSALVSEDLKGVVCGYHLAIIRPNEKIANGTFLNQLFSTPKERYYFFTLANGATRFGLSIGSIKKARFNLPSVHEQKEIAKILSISDLKIEKLQLKIHSLKEEKAALIQQLLTGKRRVITEKTIQKNY